MILYIGDKFKYIVDVMNTCFGRDYKACMRGCYTLNIDKKTSAWFPKIADLSKGTPVPGDKWYGWCNTMSSDGNFIYMNNYENPELLNKKTLNGIEPHITFVKYPGNREYTYAGVYIRTERDPEFGWIYKRIAEDIETDRYM